MDDDEGISFMLPGMTAEIIGNCVLMKCKTEEDAIILLESIKQMDGKNVIIEVRGPDNG